MEKTMQNPKLIPVPFANSGIKDDIPKVKSTSMSDEKASWETGFPEATMLPVYAGGLPPDGKDVNGVLNQISENLVFQSKGGRYKFDPDFALSIGGYQKGATLQTNDESAEYQSLIDNNLVNFNTATPEEISQAWRITGLGDAIEVLNGKFDKASVKNELGLSQTEVVSQKVVTELGSGIVGSFEDGLNFITELTNSDQLVALENEFGKQTYCWTGEFPKQVPAGSTPQSTGGVAKGAWVSVGDASLRGDLQRSESETIKSLSPLIKGQRTALNLATDIGVVGGDDIRLALLDAIRDGANEIFIPQPRNRIAYKFSGGAVDVPHHTSIVGQNNMGTQIHVTGDFLTFNSSTYYANVKNLDVAGDGTGTAYASTKGLKNFDLERLRISGFDTPLDFSNAYQGKFSRLNIENCKNGFNFKNAYMCDLTNLIVHNTGKNIFSGRACSHRAWDISYGEENGFVIGYCNGVSWNGFYMEGEMDEFISASKSVGSYGISFYDYDISMTKSGAVAFDFANGQVNTDIIFGAGTVKADSATNCTGFKFGYPASSRVSFLSQPNFLTVNSGSISNKFVYDNAYIDFNYGDAVKRIASGRITTAEYKYTVGTGDNDPSFVRRSLNSNYQEDMVDIEGGSYYTISKANIRGFIELITPDGIVVFSVNGSSNSVRIIHDPSDIGVPMHASPSNLNKYALSFNNGSLQVRNLHISNNKLILVRPHKLIHGI